MQKTEGTVGSPGLVFSPGVGERGPEVQRAVPKRDGTTLWAEVMCGSRGQECCRVGDRECPWAWEPGSWCLDAGLSGGHSRMGQGVRTVGQDRGKGSTVTKTEAHSAEQNPH